MTLDRSTAILIVDDYRDMARLIGNILKGLGFERIEEVTSGPAALEKLRDRRFGLVISDWKMQPMSGLALLRTIRADRRLAALPFIMVSGHADPEIVAAAKAAGVDGFVAKPFTAATLKGRLAAALNGPS